MQVLVSGSSGFIGSALVPALTVEGHRVVRLIRTEPRPRQSAVFWDPATGNIDRASLEGLDAVIHLAGENIASGRWTDEKKARIRDSRVRGTRLLAEALARLANPPKALICASAVGYYGHRGPELLDENSSSGSGFLAEVCREWEAASEPAVRAGTRVVRFRIGVVLSPEGGALAQMLPAFRLGLGGRIGNGKQYMSWIALDDAVGAALHALKTDNLAGPVNAVAPYPVTNAEFASTLGRVLGRPTIFPMPGFAARLVFGEMADELLLASARVQPTKLAAAGYTFRFGQLEPALRHVLRRP